MSFLQAKNEQAKKRPGVGQTHRSKAVATVREIEMNRVSDAVRGANNVLQAPFGAM